MDDLEPAPAEPPSRRDGAWSEGDIIRAVLQAVGSSALPVGPGDDAAILDSGAVVTVDTLVEGVHWDGRLTPEDVGYKLVAVSVSDLAAMGALPQWLTLSLTLPDPVDPEWTRRFCTGLAEACATWSVAVAGGDTTRSPGPRVVSVTMGGRCVAAPMLRSTARPGDDLWVTGDLGLAAEGYLSAAPSAAALQALRRPTPPLAFALDLARAGLARAAMDLSDGLAADLPRLCTASGVGAEVRPLPRPHALTGGEDYQLLFAASHEDRDAIIAIARGHRVAVSRIGTISPAPGVRLVGGGWPTPAFHHFGDA